MILGSTLGLLDGTLTIFGWGGVGKTLTDLELSLLELSFLSFFITVGLESGAIVVVDGYL